MAHTKTVLRPSFRNTVLAKERQIMVCYTTSSLQFGTFIISCFAAVCGSSLLKKKNSTRLGQLRENTGEFGRSAQGTPKLTIKKLRPARFRSTSRSVLLSDDSVFTHGFINTTLSTATFIF